MDYQGVFFDFDYTLGDSTAAIAEGYRRGFRALGLAEPTVEQVRATVGMRLEDGYTYLTGDGDPARQAEFHRLFANSVGVNAQGEDRKLMIEGTRLLPGAVELLSALKGAGVPAAIVSTKPGDTIGAELGGGRGRGLPVEAGPGGAVPGAGAAGPDGGAGAVLRRHGDRRRHRPGGRVRLLRGAQRHHTQGGVCGPAPCVHCGRPERIAALFEAVTNALRRLQDS